MENKEKKSQYVVVSVVEGMVNHNGEMKQEGDEFIISRNDPLVTRLKNGGYSNVEIVGDATQEDLDNESNFLNQKEQDRQNTLASKDQTISDLESQLAEMKKKLDEKEKDNKNQSKIVKDNKNQTLDLKEPEIKL